MVLETMASGDEKVECYECTLSLSTSMLVSHDNVALCSLCDSLKPLEHLPMDYHQVKTLPYFTQDFDVLYFNAGL